LSREEALEKARVLWDDLKSRQNNCRATPKDPPAKSYKHNPTIKDIKHPEIHSHLLSMKHKELFAWLKFHDIRTGKGKSHERCNKEELLALAEQTWNAIQNDHLNDFRRHSSQTRSRSRFPRLGRISGRCDLEISSNGSDLKEWQLCEGI
jgi:hypothetical protein